MITSSRKRYVAKNERSIGKRLKKLILKSKSRIGEITGSVITCRILKNLVTLTFGNHEQTARTSMTN